MPTETITEALANFKVVNKRIASKYEFVGRYLLRNEAMRDPLERQGTSPTLVAQERQSANDLYEMLVRIRRAISEANATNEITVDGTTRTIADWLRWKRDVAPHQLSQLRALARTIDHQRTAAQQSGRHVVGAIVASAGNDVKPGDVIVNIDEQALSKEIESLEAVLGTLDGQLSLKNATVTITY